MLFINIIINKDSPTVSPNLKWLKSHTGVSHQVLMFRTSFLSILKEAADIYVSVSVHHGDIQRAVCGHQRDDWNSL